MMRPQTIRIVGDEAQFDIYGRDGRKRGTVRIDATVAERVGEHRWYVNETRIQTAKQAGNPVITLSRWVLGLTDSQSRVYHVNGDSWDNRRANLKIARYGPAPTCLTDGCDRPDHGTDVSCGRGRLWWLAPVGLAFLAWVWRRRRH